MSTTLQFKRGNTASASAFAGANGELYINTDTKQIHVHDGATTGGFTLAKTASPTFTGTVTLPAVSANGSLGTSGQVLTSNGSSTYWAAGGGGGGSSSSFEVGEIKYASAAPTVGTWLETGKTYSKSSYSALATKLGNIPDIGPVANTPSATIPVAFGTPGSTANAAYFTATNGTVTVAVGAAGAIRTSADGITWTPCSGGTTNAYNEVRYLNGLFVAVGALGAVATSVDGYTWVNRSNPLNSASNLSSVAYGAGVYVAVGAGVSGLAIMYSYDAFTWTAVPYTTYITGNLLRVIYANSMFVAVGQNGALYTSTDGISWTARTSGTSGFIYDIIYAGGKFVYVGSANSGTSTDGITWTASGAVTFFSVAYGNSTYVAIGDLGSISSSTDGLTWTARNTATGATSYHVGGLRSIIWTGTTFYIAGSYGAYYTSTDGTTWTRYADISHAYFNTVTTIGSNILLVGQTASVLLSGSTRTVVMDSGVWTMTYAPSTYTYIGGRGVAYGSNTYVVGGTGHVYSSTDGIDWTARTLGHNSDATRVAYLGGRWFAYGLGLSTSTDLISWTAPLAIGGSLWTSVAYNGTNWVAVSGTATVAIYYSTNGTTWTSSGTNFQGTDVVWASGLSLFVAVGVGGVIATSPDGVTWTSRTSGTTNQFNRIAYLNGLLIAITNSSTIHTSTDGTTWTARSGSLVATALCDIAYSGTYFVIVGVGGNILRSSDGTTWTPVRGIESTSTFTSVVWTGTNFITGGSATSGAMYMSPDGLTWSRIASAAWNVPLLTSMSYVNNKVVTVGANIIQSSADGGVNWSMCTAFNITPGIFYRTYKLGSKYFVCTSLGLWVSSDGLSFTYVRSLPPMAAAKVAYNGSNLYMTINPASQGVPGTIFTSADGVTWTKTATFGQLPMNSTAANPPLEILYCGGNFIVFFSAPTAGVGLSHMVWTSTDGVTWTPRNLGFLGSFPTISYACTDGSTAVAVASNGAWKSTDGGATWTWLFQSTTNACVYQSGVWAIGTYISEDLVTFRNVGLNVSYGMIVTGKNIYFGVALNGTRIYGRSNAGSIAQIAVSEYPYGSQNTITKEHTLRGNTVFTVMSGQSGALYPHGILEFPLYSYNTSTTFFVPPAVSIGSETAYIYAGP